MRVNYQRNLLCNMNKVKRLSVEITAILIVAVTLVLIINKTVEYYSGIPAASLNVSEHQEKSDQILIPGSCTIFFISYEGSVFFGNNEDFKNPLTYYWTKPPEDDKYGILYFGFNDFGPQGGVNEKGLAFDGNALPYVKVNSHTERLQASESIVNNIIMQNCATVDEAIKMAYSYDWGSLYSGKFAGQYLLADSSGDAAILGFGPDGELVVTRKNRGNGYIVSTNFNRANPENRYGPYPCKRFNTASTMLESIIKRDSLTVDFLASVLDSVHEEGKVIKTLYSNIFDLKNGIVYLYYMHNFDFVCKLDVKEIINRNASPERIKSLFPKEISEQTLNLRQDYLFWITIVVVWVILTVVSNIVFYNKILKGNLLVIKNRMIWIVILIFLGPVGFILFLVSRKQNQREK